MKVQSFSERKSNLFIDIGANLTDPMFQGIYNNTAKHPADYKNVLQRAWQAGMEKIILTVGTITEADEALKFAAEDGNLFNVQRIVTDSKIV